VSDTVVKFPYSVSRRAHARRRRWSKNGTPKERAAKVALTLAQTVAATSADPAFALIAEKRAADIAHDEAIDAEELGYGTSEAACVRANEIEWKLARTMPATLAGVAAVLRLANQIEDAGGEWPNTDTIGPDGWHYQLRATMAAAIETLIKAAGKAVHP
jgi:hypothetical protein